MDARYNGGGHVSGAHAGKTGPTPHRLGRPPPRRAHLLPRRGARRAAGPAHQRVGRLGRRHLHPRLQDARVGAGGRDADLGGSHRDGLSPSPWSTGASPLSPSLPSGSRMSAGRWRTAAPIPTRRWSSGPRTTWRAGIPSWSGLSSSSWRASSATPRPSPPQAKGRARSSLPCLPGRRGLAPPAAYALARDLEAGHSAGSCDVEGLQRAGLGDACQDVTALARQAGEPPALRAQHEPTPARQHRGPPYFLLPGWVEPHGPDPGSGELQERGWHPGTSAIGTCSTAPADAFTAAGVSGADRWRAMTTPLTPAQAALRKREPKLPGSVTPSSTSRKGPGGQRPARAGRRASSARLRPPRRSRLGEPL